MLHRCEDARLVSAVDVFLGESDGGFASGDEFAVEKNNPVENLAHAGKVVVRNDEQFPLPSKLAKCEL